MDNLISALREYKSKFRLILHFSALLLLLILLLLIFVMVDFFNCKFNIAVKKFFFFKLKITNQIFFMLTEMKYLFYAVKIILKSYLKIFLYSNVCDTYKSN